MGFQVIQDDDHNLCNMGLGLGLNTSTFDQNELKSQDHADDGKELIRRFKLEPSILTLGFSSSDNNNHVVEAVDRKNYTPSLSSPNSALSNSFSNNNTNNSSMKRSSPSSVIKREKELLLVVGYHEEMEVDEKVVNSSSRVVASDEDDEGSARKKLRLTKEQSSLLEDNFKEHSTLNPKQKQALAKQLNLRPRQVEVWFQNRRARTKLKQTEVDCEFLKKCCETLTEENRKLHKELQELKALKLSQPQSMYMQLPAATLTICPSCEKIGGGGGAGDGTDGPVKNSLTMAPGKPQFYNPFKQHPSAAC